MSNQTTGEDQFRARRFDADRKDERVTFDAALGEAPTERQLLWLDIAGELEPGEVDRLVEGFDLDERTKRSFQTPAESPHMSLHGGYLHVAVAAEPDTQRPRSSPWLSIVAASNVVITHHLEPIAFLDDLDKRVEADTSFGLLDADGFLVTLLDETVTSYFRTVDSIEDEVDRLDSRSLRDRGRDELLGELVAVRRRIAALRRLLAEHRSLYAALPTVALRDEADADADHAALTAVAERFTMAIGAVEASRDVVLGSFDVYMTRTAQRTNDVMKVLTLVTVLLLPGSMIAGLLGMNVVVPLDKDSPLSFWLVVGGVILLAVAIVTIAYRRRWL